jgi:hypothetical protein
VWETRCIGGGRRKRGGDTRDDPSILELPEHQVPRQLRSLVMRVPRNQGAQKHAITSNLANGLAKGTLKTSRPRNPLT